MHLFLTLETQALPTDEHHKWIQRNLDYYALDPMLQLVTSRFPLSRKYDINWIVANHMGVNPLWMTEALCQVIQVRSGMRVLDLGCGKALGSIFLAREFGAKVWAVDSTVEESENRKRVLDFGLDGLIVCMQADASSLPFDEDFFDLAISVNAFQYFGTDPYFMDYFSNFIKESGQIGMIVPGSKSELVERPNHLQALQGYLDYHSPEWWRYQWGVADKVTVEVADMIPDGSKLFLYWLKLCEEKGAYKDFEPDRRRQTSELIQMLEADDDRNLGYVRIVSRRLTRSRGGR